MQPTEAPALRVTQGHDDFVAFVARFGDRDRQNIERHMLFCQTEAGGVHERLWKTVACMLAELAPHAVSASSQKAVRFFAADGRFRRQLFALEDLRDGVLSVYVGDALEAAIDAGAIRGPVSDDGDAQVYEASGDGGAPMRIEILTAAKTTSAPDYFKHMLGWNRKALKVSIPVTAPDASVRATHTLCRLSMQMRGT